MRGSTPEIVLVQDSREQRGYQRLFKTRCIIGTLPVGDYSIAGLENRIAIERKSLPDLLQSLTRQRTRFEAELFKARALDFFCVVVETSASNILAGRFGTFGNGCNPTSIWESIATFTVRYCPFLFVQDREGGARMVESLLGKYVREHLKILEALDKARKSSTTPELRSNSMQSVGG